MLMARARRRCTALVASDAALILGAVVLAGYARLEQTSSVGMFDAGVLPKAVLIAVVCQLCLYSRDLYERRVTGDSRTLLVRLFQGLGVTSLALAALYFWFPALVIGPGVVTASVLLVAALVATWHVGLDVVTSQLGTHERLLLVGTSAAAVSFARELDEGSLGVEIVGFVVPDSSRAGAPIAGPGVIGTIEDIPAIVRARLVDRVVVSLEDARGKLPMDKLLEMRLDGMHFAHLASVYEEYTGKIAIENLRPSWLIFSDGFRKTRLLTLTKRLVDVAAAVLGLMLTLPLQVAIAVAVKLTSPGPILYRQRRVGRDGRIFMMWKFRSMRQDAEAGTGAVWARVGDSRVTRVGRLLRRMRLDELPQLWNVLSGDMSLVGPRPERPEFVTSLTRDIAFYGQRHVIKPGLTGWAQVRYTYGASIEDAMKKLQYDLFYVKNMSPLLDVYILLRTIKIVLLGRGAC